MAWYDQVHTSKRFRLGTRKTDVAGNEYIYLQGVASLVATDFVFFDELFVTTRTVANSRGMIAIAMAAVDATTKFGWFCIWGKQTGNVATGADNANVWVTATPGRVDNTDVAVDIITNCMQRSATVSNRATFELRYPYAHNVVLN